MALITAPLVNPCNFQAIESSSVVSRRNFGLMRGQSLKNALSLLHIVNSEDSSATSAVDGQISPPNIGNGKKKVPNKVAFGQGGFGDKSCSNWMWPLGPANVVNTDTYFQAIVPFAPFKKDEISAKIMGTELIIHCCTSDDNPKPHRELYRSYQLPLNLDTSSVRFTVSRDYSRLVISGEKHAPLKLAIAFHSG